MGELTPEAEAINVNTLYNNISAKSTERLPDIEVFVKDITKSNRKTKFRAAIGAVAQKLGVPVRFEAKEHGKEPFLTLVQKQLVYKWYNFFSGAVQDTYDFVIQYFGLPEANVLKKAGTGAPLRHKGKVIYDPETGQPLKAADWDKFVESLEKFLNKRLGIVGKKIVLEGDALGRVLDRMAQYCTVEEVKKTALDELKYKNRTFDWISDSVKNMTSVFGDAISRQEAARIAVMQQSAALRITGTGDAMRQDIQQILIDGVRNRQGVSKVSQALFDKMTGHNRDFQRIADTEIQNAMNNAAIREEVYNTPEGGRTYFQRLEVVDDNTCKFCKQMNGKIAVWSNTPLEDERVKDGIAEFALWDGKDWGDGKNKVPNGTFHPYCRGSPNTASPRSRLTIRAVS